MTWNRSGDEKVVELYRSFNPRNYCKRKCTCQNMSLFPFIAVSQLAGKHVEKSKTRDTNVPIVCRFSWAIKIFRLLTVRAQKVP